ncbi:MAG TPA: hypothetical protein DCZ93_12795 [Elusimicrobia bacterium]|jgi:hypothetical protein|nr:hypothetical protein [Elusimicrobiota bacterium]
MDNYKGYDPQIELEKGATLVAASYDKKQRVTVTDEKVTVGGKAGSLKISGRATGSQDSSIDGTVNLWLSIFRYKRPDGTTNHVAGWSITVKTAPRQTAIETADYLAAYINTSARPYRAAAAGNKSLATLTIVFNEKDDEHRILKKHD